MELALCWITLQTRAGGSCPAKQGFLTTNSANVCVCVVVGARGESLAAGSKLLGAV